MRKLLKYAARSEIAHKIHQNRAILYIKVVQGHQR